MRKNFLSQISAILLLFLLVVSHVAFAISFQPVNFNSQTTFNKVNFDNQNDATDSDASTVKSTSISFSSTQNFVPSDNKFVIPIDDKVDAEETNKDDSSNKNSASSINLENENSNFNIPIKIRPIKVIGSLPEITISATYISELSRVYISGVATDIGYDSGIQNIYLFEDEEIIETKNCKGANTCVFSKYISYDVPETHDYMLRTKDNSGNYAVSKISTITFGGANNNPSIVESSPEEFVVVIPEENTQNFRITAQDPENHDLTIKWKVDGNLVKTTNGLTSQLSFNRDVTEDESSKVEVFVYDKLGGATYQRWDLTIVDSLPEAILSYDETVLEGETVNFDASDSQGYDRPLSFTWNFGDINLPVFPPVRVNQISLEDDEENPIVPLSVETKSLGDVEFNKDLLSREIDASHINLYSGMHTAHTYYDSGAYVVTLTVADSEGDVDRITSNIIVQEIDPVINDVDFDSTVSEGEDFNLDVDASSLYPNADAITLYEVRFGNEQVLTNDDGDFTYVFKDQGTQELIIRVYDEDTYTEETHSVVVQDITPVIEPINDFTANEGEEISFSVSAHSESPETDAITSYNWDFNGEGSANTQDATFSFDDQGAKDVTVTVCDEDSCESESFVVAVEDHNPEVEFTNSFENFIEGQEYIFTIDAIDIPEDLIVNYDWDFDGDGIFDETTLVSETSFIYVQNGTYDLTVSINDEDNSLILSRTFDVADTIPVISLNANPLEILEGESTNVTVVSTAYDGFASRVLDFGNGQTLDITSDEESHLMVYNLEDLYNITFTTIDNDGSEVSDSLEINVLNNAPEVNLILTPITGTEPLFVNIDCLVANGNKPYNATISIIDETSTNLIFEEVNTLNETFNTNFTFSHFGEYNVSCQVIDVDGDVDSEVETIIVDAMILANFNSLEIIQPEEYSMFGENELFDLIVNFTTTTETVSTNNCSLELFYNNTLLNTSSSNLVEFLSNESLTNYTFPMETLFPGTTTVQVIGSCDGYENISDEITIFIDSELIFGNLSTQIVSPLNNSNITLGNLETLEVLFQTIDYVENCGVTLTSSNESILSFEDSISTFTLFNTSLTEFANFTTSSLGNVTVTINTVCELGTGSSDSINLTVVEEVIIPNNAPTFNMTNTTFEVFENQTFTVLLNASDIDGDVLSFATNATSGTFNETSGLFNWTTNNSDLGTHVFSFNVTDGEYTDTINLTFNVMEFVPINHAPVLDAFSVTTPIYENETVFIDLNASDIDGDTLTYFTNTTLGTFNSTTGIFNWTTNLTNEGIYSFEFGVTDGELNDSEIIVIEVLNFNELGNIPLIDEITDLHVVEGDLIEFNVTAREIDGDLFNLTKTSSEGMFTNQTNILDNVTSKFTWQTTESDNGTYYITFEAEDVDGIFPITVQVTIDDYTNVAPILENISNYTVNETQNLAFTVVANDANGDALTYNVTSLPVGATYNISTQEFDWTPSANQSGVYTLTFDVNDGEFSDSQEITITVVDQELDLSITSNPVSGNSPLTVDFDSLVLNADGNITYSWDFNNDGIIDSTNKNDSYNYTTAGIFIAVLNVFDEDGSIATQSATITVNTPFRAISVDSINYTNQNRTVWVGDEVNVSGVISNNGLYNESVTAQLLIDGIVVESKDVFIIAGASLTISFQNNFTIKDVNSLHIKTLPLLGETDLSNNYKGTIINVVSVFDAVSDTTEIVANTTSISSGDTISIYVPVQSSQAYKTFYDLDVLLVTPSENVTITPPLLQTIDTLDGQEMEILTWSLKYNGTQDFNVSAVLGNSEMAFKPISISLGGV